MRLLRRQLAKRPILVLLCVLAFIYLGATSLIMLSEGVGFAAATDMLAPAFLGELGQIESDSIVSRTSILLALVASIAFLAIVTAKITSLFIEFCRRGGSIVRKVNLSDHVVICGWNFQGRRIVDELLKSSAIASRGLVVLADCEQRPLQDERVEFVKGDPTQDEDLIRAGVDRSRSVIVLSDFAKQANEADAEALMIVLAVESLNRASHTCVQIMSSSNRIHLERAHADEIVCLDEIGGNLVVSSAINHGVSRIVSELLTFNRGSEFYRYSREIPNHLIGTEFSEAVRKLAERKILLIAVETDDSAGLREALPHDVLHPAEEGSRAIIVNPQGGYRIQSGDGLFFIAESEPQSL